MELIEQIGSYAGFAAVVGLGVLSALYFSQARDLKRLREWAGRAPERTAQIEADVAARAASKPAQQTPPGQPAAPGAKPAPGQAPPVTPKPQVASGPKPQTASAATATSPTGAGPNGAQSPSVPGKPVKPVTPPPPRITPRPAKPLSGLSPVASKGPRERWYHRISWPEPRYLALLVAGVVVLGAGGAYALGVFDSSSEPASAPAPGAAEPADEQTGERAAPIVPENVTVSVLNGTAVTGLARQIGDELESRGFQIGNVTNASEQTGERAESVALYAGGAKREARAVARALGISQIEEADANAQQLGGGAAVIVIVGLDQTQ